MRFSPVTGDRVVDKFLKPLFQLDLMKLVRFAAGAFLENLFLIAVISTSSIKKDAYATVRCA